MRILGYLNHPQLKITVFKADDRLSIKFENTRYEQTYKLGADDRVHNLETARSLVDAEFMLQVSNHFREMHHTRFAAFARNFPESGDLPFDDII